MYIGKLEWQPCPPDTGQPLNQACACWECCTTSGIQLHLTPCKINKDLTR